MKSMATALIMVLSITLSGMYGFKGQEVEVSMVSRHEMNYLLVSGKTTIPQSSKVVTVDYNGKQYDVLESKLYEGFKEGKKVKVALSDVF